VRAINTRRPSEYDAAIELLKDLRAVSEREERRAGSCPTVWQAPEATPRAAASSCDKIGWRKGEGARRLR